MKIRVGLPDFRSYTHAIEGDIASASTAAMRETTPEALLDLRRQTTSAGLSQRLANTWRGEVYPKSRQSMTPAGYIWSHAPDIIDAFTRGATIVPINGKRFLAIPTDAVPRARGRRGSTKKMSPEEVEQAFSADLFYLRGKNGKVLAFLNLVQGRSGKGYRRATAGRAKQGRHAKPILMFILTPSVRMPKLFDLDATANRWANRYTSELTRRLEA